MDKKVPSLWGGIMERLKLGSVLDSLIAILIIIGTLLVVSIFSKISWLIIAVFIVFVIVLLVSIGTYIFWTIKDSDKLRSSDHEIQKLQLIHGMGDNTKQFNQSEVAELPTVNNPELEKTKGLKAKKR